MRCFTSVYIYHKLMIVMDYIYPVAYKAIPNLRPLTEFVYHLSTLVCRCREIEWRCDGVERVPYTDEDFVSNSLQALLDAHGVMALKQPYRVINNFFSFVLVHLHVNVQFQPHVGASSYTCDELAILSEERVSTAGISRIWNSLSTAWRSPCSLHIEKSVFIYVIWKDSCFH